MNNERRKQIALAQDLLAQAAQIIYEAQTDEQDSFDNLPEGLQASERGERMEEIASSLEEAATQIDDIIETLNDCCIA